MKHARSDYDRIQDPAGLIPEDEPVFLIRGQDMLAPAILRRYADSAELVGVNPDLIKATRLQASKMEEWQKSIGVIPKMPDIPTGSARLD